MDLKDIRLLSTEELKTKQANTRQEYMNLRFQMVTGQLTDTSRLRQVRRQIAQFETILHDRELEAMKEGAK
ncbi:MAG: 50S ribosomal protein L29 [Anaerolineaceae bacterium]|jgi:large subunit ribosomal protein L29